MEDVAQTTQPESGLKFLEFFNLCSSWLLLLLLVVGTVVVAAVFSRSSEQFCCSILKLQVCNFAEIKRSYENSTAGLSIDRSIGGRDGDVGEEGSQLRSIFNLCLALWLKSEQSSQSRPRGNRWQPLATLSRPLYAHKMSFCARRLTRHPNQSQALYGVSGKAQPLALLGSSLGSGDCSSDCDSGAGRAASLAARHHYLCAANIANNMKKTQQQFPRTDRRLKAGKEGRWGGRSGQLHVQSLVVSFQIEAANKLFQSIRFSSPGITWGSSSIARLDRSIAGQRNFDSLDSLDSSSAFWDELWPARFPHQLS